MPPTAEVSPTPTETPAATPAAQEPAQAPSGTAETSGSEASPQAQTAPSEETFFTGDPNSLPPELQQAYKNMLKDYKAKTQEIAETRKKAQAFDQISADQRFRDYWSGLSRQERADFKEQKAEAEKALGQKISDEEFAKGFESKDSFLALLERVIEEKGIKAQSRIKELEQKLTVNEAGDVVEAFATELGQDGKPMRPDFYSLNDPKYNLITGYLSVYPPEENSPEAYRQRLSDAYSWAKTLTQDFYNKGKQEALAIIQKKAANGSEMPTHAAKGAYTGPDPKKLSVREAIELAKKGQKIPQVYD